MTLFDCAQSMQSWVSYAARFDSYYTVQSMENLFRDLFGVDYRDVKFERETYETQTKK